MNTTIGSHGAVSLKGLWEMELSAKSIMLMLSSLLLLVPFMAQAGTVLSTSKTSIGVNNEGDLIYQYVGLRYVPTNGEALTPGCDCEGWGVADLYTKKYAKAGRSFGRAYVTVESFTADDISAKSVVNAAGIMRVTHHFTESNTEHLFQVRVTIENTSANPIHLLYRRAMDWDVPPTVFNEMVTIVTNGAKDVKYSSDNGFADGNPLVSAGKRSFIGEAVDNGPNDHGAVFDFDFGELLPGESKEFFIYYGAAANEEESLDALSIVGAEVYSLGKPNPAHYLVSADGSPNTFIFGFGGVGGKALVRPMPDFTLGGLKIIDNGLGQALELETRIGSAGHKDAKQPASVNVSFYDGDPASGGVLIGVKEVPSLAPGHYQDIRLETDKTVSNSVIYAKVDAENAIAECRESNNSQQIAFTPSTTVGSILVFSDKQVYSEGDTASLSATVANTGSFDYQLNAQLKVEDGDGYLIQTFPVEDLGLVASGAEVEIQSDWLSAGYLAGDYRVHGLLTDQNGELVSETYSNFRVDHDYSASPAASLKVAVDRVSYHVNDEVGIESTVGNLTSGVTIKNPAIELVLEDSAGAVVYQDVVNISSLVPSQYEQRNRTFVLSKAAVGQYQLKAALVGNDGFVFATDATTFDVVNDMGMAIKGSATVQYGELFRGDSQLCTFNIENTGVVDAGAVSINKLIVNIADESIVASNEQEIDLAAGAETTLLNGFETQGYTIGDYVCVIQAKIDEVDTTLASVMFKVLPPPISLDISSVMGDRGRILILMDALDYHDELDASSVLVQANYLKTLLDSDGWSYTIVHDADEFASEFYSGQYVAYGLFANRVTLEPDVELLLVDALNSGEGLLINGAINRRNNKIEKALELSISGKEQKSVDVVVPQGSLSTEWAGGMLTPAISIDLNPCKAEAVALYQLSKSSDKVLAGCDADLGNAAVTRHNYGNGVASFIGFDALDESIHEDAAVNVAAELLGYGFREIHPEHLSTDGNAIPLNLLVRNTGVEVQVRITLWGQSGGAITTVPDGWSWAVSNDGLGYWQMQQHLTENAAIEDVVYVQLTGGMPYTVNMRVEVSEDGTNWEPYDDQIVQLAENAEITHLTGLLNLLADMLVDNGSKALEHAIKHAQLAQSAQVRGELGETVHQLLMAVGYLNERGLESARLETDAVLLRLLRDVAVVNQ